MIFWYSKSFSNRARRLALRAMRASGISLSSRLRNISAERASASRRASLDGGTASVIARALTVISWTGPYIDSSADNTDSWLYIALADRYPYEASVESARHA